MKFNGETMSARMTIATVVVADNQIGQTGWSSKNIVDKLCPAIDESGSVVTCEPFEGYPLEVVSVIPETQLSINGLSLFRGGKNLFNFTTGASSLEWVTEENTEVKYGGYIVKLPAGVYTVHSEKKASTTANTYYIGCDVIGADGVRVARAVCGGGALIWGDETSRNTRTVTLREGDSVYVFCGSSGGYSDLNASNRMLGYDDIQIEAGSTATPYEEYRGEVFTADFSKFPHRANDGGAYNWITGVFTDFEGNEWQHNIETGEFEYINTNDYVAQVVRSIPALAGTNFLYEENGTVEVKGRKDLVKTIEELTNAIIALGGNI